MFGSQETEDRRQSGSINIAMDSVKYQSIHKQNDEQQHHQQKPLPAQKAYVLTEIENRPLVNFNIPHPPLQTVYPKSIQNNVESRVVNRPTLNRQYSSSSIPLSLPSIVHEPSNTVATIQNVPDSFASSLSNVQRYSSSPVITSTYSNRESFSNSNVREKVVVKVVKAPGWYLNDPNERSSYFEAVAHGLLSDNGLVYVNNVQKESAGQNAPINSPTTSSNIGTPANSYTQTSPNQSPSVAYSPKNIIPPALLQSQAQYTSGNPTQYNSYNYWPPCATSAYSQSISTAIPQLPLQSQTQTQSQYQKRSSNDPYTTGQSSYNVNLDSIGKLAGDGNPHQYNFASLRQPQHQ